MKLGLVRTIVGFSIVFLHFGAIGYVFFGLQKEMTTTDFNITILIISPVLLTYVLAFGKFVIVNRNIRASTEVVSFSYAIFVVVLISVTGIVMIYSIYQYDIKTIVDSDELKQRLAIVEVITGGLLGLFMDDLFKVEDSNSQGAIGRD